MNWWMEKCDFKLNTHPQWKPQAIVFGIVTNKKFDMIIMIFIALNMATMTLDHYGQSDMWNFALDNLNMGFIVVFTTECILKIFALRQYYFTEPWNVFDFVVVVLSICGEQPFLSRRVFLLIFAPREFLSVIQFFTYWSRTLERRGCFSLTV